MLPQENICSSATRLAPDETLCVLLIEDNPGDARLLRELLVEAGSTRFRLEHVLRLSAGLERLAAGGVDLVLLDLSLPDSRGLSTFHKTHACAPQVPLIVLSGLNDEELAIKTVQEGAQDYLVKGHADGLLLVRAMRYAIERKRAEVELARYAAALQKKNEEMEADLRMAREVQQAFLPRQYPVFPHGVAPSESALCFCHRWIPATTLGGDFFDVLALSDTEAGVLIVDVMGHGLRSALVTATLRAAVGERTAAARDPSLFLAELNRQLYKILDHADSTLFASAFYLVADVSTGELRYAGAGHPVPLLLRRRGGSVAPLPGLDEASGPALGVLRQADFPLHQCAVGPGDAVVLFTDGVIEAAGPDGEYGEARLAALLQRHLDGPLPEVFDALLNEMRAFTNRREFDDDVCLVGLEVARTGQPDTSPSFDASDL
jgi:serine phosphatase RsbU (regulator of sigma subunit)